MSRSKTLHIIKLALKRRSEAFPSDHPGGFYYFYYTYLFLFFKLFRVHVMLLRRKPFKDLLLIRFPGFKTQSLDGEVTKRNSLLNSHNKSAPNDSRYRLSKVFPSPRADSGAVVGQKATLELMSYKETPGSAARRPYYLPALLQEKVMFIKSLLQHDCTCLELATACRCTPHM